MSLLLILQVSVPRRCDDEGHCQRRGCSPRDEAAGHLTLQLEAAAIESEREAHQQRAFSTSASTWGWLKSFRLGMCSSKGWRRFQKIALSHVVVRTRFVHSWKIMWMIAWMHPISFVASAVVWHLNITNNSLNNRASHAPSRTSYFLSYIISRTTAKLSHAQEINIMEQAFSFNVNILRISQWSLMSV